MTPGGFGVSASLNAAKVLHPPKPLQTGASVDTATGTQATSDEFSADRGRAPRPPSPRPRARSSPCTPARLPTAGSGAPVHPAGRRSPPRAGPPAPAHRARRGSGRAGPPRPSASGTRPPPGYISIAGGLGGFLLERDKRAARVFYFEIKEPGRAVEISEPVSGQSSYLGVKGSRRSSTLA